MRSIQLLAPCTLEERDIPFPRDPGPGEILVKIHSVGICGSDLHWYLDGHIGTHPASYPMVLGHEPAGEVIAVGGGVTEYRPGDRVSVEPSLTCGHCEFCLMGRHNNCLHSSFMGTPGEFGLLREYATVPQQNAVRFPDGLSFEQATLIEPLAVIMHMLEYVEIRPWDTVAVLGAGPIGLLAAAVARASGASPVISADKVPHRLALARKMGATLAVEIGQAAEAVRDATGGRGADLVIDAAGSPQTINTALAIARRAGTCVLIGLAVEREIPVQIHEAMYKELRIQTLKRSNHRCAPAIQMLASGAVKDALITHTAPLAKTPEAFEMLAGYRDGVGKLVIEIDQ